MAIEAPVRTITATLTRRALSWAVLCTVVFGALQAWLTYQSAQADFQAAVRNAANTHVKLLSVSVWDLDVDAIQRQVDSLLDSKSIGFAEVRLPTGQVFRSGQVALRNESELLVLPIAQPDKPTNYIGFLELMVDKHAQYRKVLSDVALVLLQALVLTALIVGAVVAVLRRDLQHPMQQFIDFVTELRPDDLSHRLELQRAPGHLRDDIDVVADGFRSLQDRIHQHIDELDHMVAERTRQLNDALNTLRKLSTTDALTGCYNRLLFNERFPGELSRAQRYVKPLSIIFCDVDHFKSVNDNHGHGVGDQVLAEVGECLRRLMRADRDWVVRYGGEEFVLVLPETSLSIACDIAERLRQEVSLNACVTLEGDEVLRVTISLGVAEQREGETMEHLLNRADEWLYVAKKSGRNQVQPIHAPAPAEALTHPGATP